MMNMVGRNGNEAVEMVEMMGLEYEVCYYDDDVTIAGIDVYGVEGCDYYAFECDVDGMVECQYEGYED